MPNLVGVFVQSIICLKLQCDITGTMKTVLGFLGSVSSDISTSLKNCGGNIQSSDNQINDWDSEGGLNLGDKAGNAQVRFKYERR